MTNRSYWVRSQFLQDQSPLMVSQVTLTEHTERACASACFRKCQVKTLLVWESSHCLLDHVHQTSALVSLISSNHSLTHSDRAWHFHQSYIIACGPLSSQHFPLQDTIWENTGGWNTFLLNSNWARSLWAHALHLQTQTERSGWKIDW